MHFIHRPLIDLQIDFLVIFVIYTNSNPNQITWNLFRNSCPSNSNNENHSLCMYRHCVICKWEFNWPLHIRCIKLTLFSNPNRTEFSIFFSFILNIQYPIQINKYSKTFEFCNQDESSWWQGSHNMDMRWDIQDRTTGTWTPHFYQKFFMTSFVPSKKDAFLWVK